MFLPVSIPLGWKSDSIIRMVVTSAVVILESHEENHKRNDHQSQVEIVVETFKISSERKSEYDDF